MILRTEYTILLLLAALTTVVSCSSPKQEADIRPSILPAEPPPEKLALMRNPDITLAAGDTLRMSVTLPNRKYAALETIEKNGEVATPDGSFIRAGGLSLAQFRTDLANLYRDIRGYQEAKVDAFVHSSPYKVVVYPANRSTPTTNRTAALLLPRVFRAPLTVWEAVDNEGGIPRDVDSSKIHLLTRDLVRKTLDCSGPDGRPDGTNLVASGDVIFLVPAGTPLHGIFE